MARNAISGRRGFAGRIAFLAVAENEEAACGKAEEDPIHDDNIAEDLFVRSQQDHSDCERSLKRDGPDGYARGGAEPREYPRKDAVFRHRVINTWLRKQGIAEETECGRRDSCGN